MTWLGVVLFGAIWAVAASYLAPSLTGFGGPVSLAGTLMFVRYWSAHIDGSGEA